MMQSVLSALAAVHASNAMHCDFKPDQMAFNLRGEAKLVDLDTMQWYSKGGEKKLFSGRSCKAQDTAKMRAGGNHRELVQCCGHGCMKHSTPQEDCICNTEAGTCPGVSSETTLAQVACKMLFADMFFSSQHLNAANTPAAVATDLQRMSEGCLDQLWGLKRASDRLDEIWTTHDGAGCVLQSQNQTADAVTAAFTLRRDTAKEKCRQRYC